MRQSRIPDKLSRRRRQGAPCWVFIFCMSVEGLLSSFSGPVYAEDSTLPEHEIKAAMLYKFLSYVEWPPSTFRNDHEPYRIGIVGSSRLEKELRRITHDQTINNRAIEIFRVRDTDDLDEPHMVFVGQKSENLLPALARLAEKSCFLVVTEDDDGIKKGSTINLRVINDRVGFDVSLVSANKCSFKLSARLLSVAASVKQDDG